MIARWALGRRALGRGALASGLLTSGLLASIVAIPSIVSAQGSSAETNLAPVEDAVTVARQLYEQASFAEARDALDVVLTNRDLERATLAEILALRAMVSFALNRPSDLERDVTLLAAVDPDRDLGLSAPPPVQEAFETARARREGPIELRITLDETAGELTIDGVVERAPGELHPAVRLSARLGAGVWQHRASPLVLGAAGGARVEYYGEVVGIGGAVLARTGSAEVPLVHEVPAPRGSSAPALVPEDDGPSALPWVLGGIGLAVVAAAVILVIVLASAERTTLVNLPPPPG
jgi:hypothetical protein